MAHLSPYWIKLEGHTPVCVEDETRDGAIAQAVKLTNRKVLSCERLPYPARPRISERKSPCPDFCYSPSECAGRTSCPKSYACSE